MGNRYTYADICRIFNVRNGVDCEHLHQDFVPILCAFGDLYKSFNPKATLTITSAYRNPEHNERVGGVKNSAHTLGLAVDISCTTSTERFYIIGAALSVGIFRIGINKTYIHLDIDANKSNPVIFLY